MTIGDEKVVAWLCDAGDGKNVDATPREFVRDDYARFGRIITPLIPQSAYAELAAELAEHNGKHPNGDPVRTEPTPAEAQAQGGGEVVWSTEKPRHSGVYGVRGFNFEATPEEQFEAIVAVRLYEGDLICNLHESTSEDDFDRWTPVEDCNDGFEWCEFTPASAPPSAPVGVETVDAAAWTEVLELPEGFRVAEHLPGIWEYQFDIEDEADEDSDRKVSGASWNHPALAAIAAWGHAYDTLAQQPAAVDGATEPLFYLQDSRSYIGNCPLWWCPDGKGYTTRLDEAGKYTHDAAMRQQRDRETDVPWPCEQIDAISRPTVDMQDMRRPRRPARRLRQ